MRSGCSPIRRQEPLGRRTEALARRTCLAEFVEGHMGNYGDKAIVLLFAKAFSAHQMGLKVAWEISVVNISYT